MRCLYPLIDEVDKLTFPFFAQRNVIKESIRKKKILFIDNRELIFRKFSVYSCSVIIIFLTFNALTFNVLIIINRVLRDKTSHFFLFQ